MANTDIVRPSAVMGSDGTITKVQQRRDAVKDFPGQSESCPFCGAMASEAPEGLYGITYRTDASHEHGDPVWEFEHCWKCGYRSGAKIEALMVIRRQFEQWLAEKTKDDMSHPTVAIDSANDAEKEILIARLKEMESKLDGLMGVKPDIAPASNATLFTGGQGSAQ